MFPTTLRCLLSNYHHHRLRTNGCIVRGIHGCSSSSSSSSNYRRRYCWRSGGGVVTSCNTTFSMSNNNNFHFLEQQSTAIVPIISLPNILTSKTISRRTISTTTKIMDHSINKNFSSIILKSLHQPEIIIPIMNTWIRSFRSRGGGIGKNRSNGTNKNHNLKFIPSSPSSTSLIGGSSLSTSEDDDNDPNTNNEDELSESDSSSIRSSSTTQAVVIKKGRFEQSQQASLSNSQPQPPPPLKLIRLNKLMANLGYGSRREADEYIKNGYVCVNGIPVPAKSGLGMKINENETVRITLTNDAIEQLNDPMKKPVTIIYYKPFGILSGRHNRRDKDVRSKYHNNSNENEEDDDDNDDEFDYEDDGSSSSTNDDMYENDIDPTSRNRRGRDKIKNTSIDLYTPAVQMLTAENFYTNENNKSVITTPISTSSSIVQQVPTTPSHHDNDAADDTSDDDDEPIVPYKKKNKYAKEVVIEKTDTTKQDKFSIHLTLKQRKQLKKELRHSSRKKLDFWKLGRDEPCYLPKLGLCGRLDLQSTGLLLYTQNGNIARTIIGEKNKNKNHNNIQNMNGTNNNKMEKEYLVRIGPKYDSSQLLLKNKKVQQQQQQQQQQTKDSKDEVEEVQQDQQRPQQQQTFDLTLNDPIIVDKIQRIQRGLRDPFTKEILRVQSITIQNKEQLKIILTEGKYHHIRRICELSNWYVKGLKRVRIGPIHLGNLQPGFWRYCTEQEIQQLLQYQQPEQQQQHQQHQQQYSESIVPKNKKMKNNRLDNDDDDDDTSTYNNENPTRNKMKRNASTTFTKNSTTTGSGTGSSSSSSTINRTSYPRKNINHTMNNNNERSGDNNNNYNNRNIRNSIYNNNKTNGGNDDRRSTKYDPNNNNRENHNKYQTTTTTTTKKYNSPSAFSASTDSKKEFTHTKFNNQNNDPNYSRHDRKNNNNSNSNNNYYNGDNDKKQMSSTHFSSGKRNNDSNNNNHNNEVPNSRFTNNNYDQENMNRKNERYPTTTTISKNVSSSSSYESKQKFNKNQNTTSEQRSNNVPIKTNNYKKNDTFSHGSTTVSSNNNNKNEYTKNERVGSVSKNYNPTMQQDRSNNTRHSTTYPPDIPRSSSPTQPLPPPTRTNTTTIPKTNFITIQKSPIKLVLTRDLKRRQSKQD